MIDHATGMKRPLNYVFLLIAILVAVSFLIASRKDKASAPATGPGGRTQAEAPLVRVREVVEKEIADTREYIGRVEAIDSVDLVARVSGYLKSIDFMEGRDVAAGELMFTIEKDRFRAEIDARKGMVLQIEANLAEAEKYLRRLKSANRGSVPEKDIESAQRDVDYNKAQLISANANLKLSGIDLDYTTVRAPISGRITQKHYSVGDYIGPNSGTIATIVKTDPIREVCSMSEVDYLNLMERSGSSPEKIFRPSLRLPNGSLYPKSGVWDFADTAIDTSTGTISLRSRYANPDGLLIPGGYVTVVLTPVREERFPLVPQAAVMEGRDGSYVYVVAKNNVTEMRIIKKRSVFGTDWVVEEGIESGEVVIVEGIQKVQPGQVVKISSGTAEAVSTIGSK